MSFENGEKKTIAVGPWGGYEGFRWDDGVYSTIRQLVIVHAAAIDSIQIEYDKKAASIWSDKHGGTGGYKTDTIKLDFPDEFLTSVRGHYGSLHDWGLVYVRSLTFESNRKTYGPYGTEQGTYFSFPMSGGKIVGFHGRSGTFLDAIGVYLKPLQPHKSSNALVQTHSYISNGTDNVGYSVMQGRAGNTFDIVVAVRQKDEHGNPLQSNLPKQNSREFRDAGSNHKIVHIYKMPSNPDNVVTSKTWGGSGGSAFNDGIYTGIRQIHLSRNVAVVSFRVQYDQGGKAIWGSKHGGTGAFKMDKIIFDYPYEKLMYITGTYGPLMYMGPNTIRSLTFYTNKGKHGPYGEEQGPSFTSKINEGQIVGFHGREGFFLDGIGVHVMEGEVKPIKHSLSDAIIQNKAEVAEIENSPWSNKLVVAKRGQTAEVACSVMKDPDSCGPGPWGGEGGRPWDDGVFSGIKQIFMLRSAEGISSMQIEYDRNGQSIWSVKHGGNGGSGTHRVKLEYPHEVLTRVSGFYGSATKDESLKVIKSLTFYTSRGKYGPFGEEVGTFFTSATTEGKILGFHGRSSAYLDAVGVHVQHWLGNNRTSYTKSSFFKNFPLIKS